MVHLIKIPSTLSTLKQSPALASDQMYTPYDIEQS